MYNTIKNKKWLQKKGLVFFMPSILRMIKLWFNLPKGPEIETESKKNITCYWISSGTWGAYRPPNKIFICPEKIPNINKVIIHELTHLQYEKEVCNLSHEDKEKYINNKQKNNLEKLNLPKRL